MHCICYIVISFLLTGIFFSLLPAGKSIGREDDGGRGGASRTIHEARELDQRNGKVQRLGRQLLPSAERKRSSFRPAFSYSDREVRRAY